jgi:hypothetical protein
MKPRRVIIPALMASVLFAQGRGGFGPRGGDNGTTGNNSTPPTAEQLATREVNLISMALRLSTTETSAMLTDLACASSATTVIATTPCALTAEQNVLHADAATLKTDWTALASDLASTPPTSTSATVTAINGLELSNLEARVGAAGAVLAELATLKVTLTATDQTKLLNLLVHGSGRSLR